VTQTFFERQVTWDNIWTQVIRPNGEDVENYMTGSIINLPFIKYYLGAYIKEMSVVFIKCTCNVNIMKTSIGSRKGRTHLEELRADGK
jgi:hypothetical protein